MRLPAPLAALGCAPVALAIVLSIAPEARSQVPPGGGNIPSKQEIEKRLEEEFNKLPDETAELEGVKVVYKAIPTDPKEALKSSGQLPPGSDPEQVAKQFAPMARPYIEKYAGKVGKLTVEKEFKYRATKVVPGEYTFGLVMDDLTPVAVSITGGSLRAPLQVPIAAGKPPAEPYAALKVTVVEGKTKGDFAFAIGFAKLEGHTPKLTFKK